MPSVDDSIQFVKGIGPKKAKLFEKLHIRTLRDALETYPRDYEDRTHITLIAEIDMEDKYAVRAVVGTEPKVNRIRKGLTLVKCTIYDETGTLNVTYFNNPYAAAQLRVGQEYVFYGKVQGYGRGRTMVSPQSEKVAPDADHPGRIVPVYPLTAGLTQRDLERVTAARTFAGEIPLARRSRCAFCHSPTENQGRCGAGAPTHGIRGAVFALLRPAAAEGAPKGGFRHCFYLEWIGFVL